MKTLALVFAWVPLMLAFMAHGPGGAQYVIWSSMLLCVGVEICDGLRALASMRSIDAVIADYNRQFYAAIESYDLRTADQILAANRLFIELGAA